MKKTLIALTVMGMVLACSEAVFAASQTSVLMDSWGYLATAEGAIHANANGWVTFKTSKGGGMDLTVQLYNGAPLYKYLVISKSIQRGTFTTDKKGNGSLQVHVTDASTLGEWVCIWTSDRKVNLLCAYNRFWSGS